MSVRRISVVISALLVLSAALLYLPGLRDAPPYLSRDEILSALTAHSLATDGHDLNGRFLPLYFQVPVRFVSHMWFQPMLMYAIALSIRILPFSEATVRLPMACLGVTDVVLMYVVAKLWFRREVFAVAAAALLAMTPAHLVYSRWAMDYQAPLPFILGWLICMLMHLRTGKYAWLFAAGFVLGAGLYTHIAASVLMPLYLALSSIALLRNRAHTTAYLALAGGFAIPLLLGVVWVAQHPTVIRDIFWHYQVDDPHGSVTTLALLKEFASFNRFAEAVSRYAGFWNPRLLFVTGPRGAWVAGQFLLPIAGLIGVGLVASFSRPSPWTLFVVVGLLTAPMPASLLNEPEAIRRTTEMLPFAVLLAVAGLEVLWSAPREDARRLAFVAVWAAAAGIAVLYHDRLVGAQAFVRGATVPLAAVGVAVLSRRIDLRRLPLGHIVAVALLTIALIQIGQLTMRASTLMLASTVLLVVVCATALLPESLAPFVRHPIALVVLIAAISCEMTQTYVEYTDANIHRVMFLPQPVVLLAVQLLFASATAAAALGATRWIQAAVDGPVASVTATAIELSTLCFAAACYFYIDHFTDFRMRFSQAAAVVVAVVAIAAVESRSVRLRTGQIAAAAVFTLASIQFATFSVDYFGDASTLRNSGAEGNVRIAMERVLEETRDRTVPAVHLAGVGFGDVYWRFYAMKHRREDLLSRTTDGASFEPDSVRHLPAGSIVLTSVSGDTDGRIDRMRRGGQLRHTSVVAAFDGTPIVWILETGAP